MWRIKLDQRNMQTHKMVGTARSGNSASVTGRLRTEETIYRRADTVIDRAVPQSLEG